MKIRTDYAQVLASSQSSFSNCQCSCTINMLTMLHVHYSKLWPCYTRSPNNCPFLLHCHYRSSEWLGFASVCTLLKILDKVLPLAYWLSHTTNSFLCSYSAVQLECLGSLSITVVPEGGGGGGRDNMTLPLDGYSGLCAVTYYSGKNITYLLI